LPKRFDDLVTGRGYDWLQEIWPQLDQDWPFWRVLGIESPKIRLVGRAIRAASPAEARRLIRTTADLDQVLILEGDAATLPPAHFELDESDLAKATCRVMRYTPNSVAVQVDVTKGAGAWLVYADNYTTGWHVDVDGKAAVLEPAYLAFKAVHLHAGRHKVEFNYRPVLMGPLRNALFWLGATTAAAALAALICCLMYWDPHRRDVCHLEECAS